MGRESGSAPPPRGISPAVSYSALANLPSPELATNPASAGGSVMDDGRATLVSVPGSAASTCVAIPRSLPLARPGARLALHLCEPRLSFPISGPEMRAELGSRAFFADRRGTALTVPAPHHRRSDSYSTTYVIERPYQPHRRGFWDVLGLGLNKKRGVARPLLFPSPPGTPSPFASNASWRTRVRKFVWSEEMRYMLVALCFFCVLIQVRARRRA